MVLKDWKKVLDQYHIIKYINKYEDEKEIAIEPSGRGDWVVWYLEPEVSFIRLSRRHYRSFSTKSLALKFCKKWMKEN